MNTQLTKQLLFCPGPVNLANNVKAAAIQADVCHREKEFEQTMQRLQTNVLKVLEIRHPKQYAAIFVTGSGTAGNETILSSLGNKRVLVLTNGEFGERILAIAKVHHKFVKRLDFGWGKEMNPVKVEEYVKKYKINAIAMVHHETSSGMLNPIQAVGQIAHKYHTLFLVDAVSSATAEKIDVEKSHITFMNTTSGKAFASFPGIAAIVGKKEAFEALAKTQPKTTYLNLYKFYHYATNLNQTPNTPGVQLFFALDMATQNIITEGIQARRERIAKLAAYMREKMQKLGLTFLLEDNMSSVVTSVYLPQGITFKKIRNELRKKNIIVYNGKGPFKDRIFQVGHIGELSMKDAKYFLSCLKAILATSSKKHMHKQSADAAHTFSFPEFVQKLPQAFAALLHL